MHRELLAAYAEASLDVNVEEKAIARIEEQTLLSSAHAPDESCARAARQVPSAALPAAPRSAARTAKTLPTFE